MDDSIRSHYPDELFRDLALVSPAEIATEDKIIFTSRPWRWSSLRQRESQLITVVDVSRIACNTYPLQFEHRSKPGRTSDSVVRAFLSNGWADHQIKCNIIYDSGAPKIGLEIDLAILDDSGSFYVILEVKVPSLMGYSQLADIIEHRFLSSRLKPASVWFGATDGSTYYFVHGASRLCAEFDHAPSYLELESRLAGGLSDPSHNIVLQKPLSLDNVREIVSSTAAKHAVLDESLWGLKIAERKADNKSYDKVDDLLYSILPLLSEQESSIAAITVMTPSS